MKSGDPVNTGVWAAEAAGPMHDVLAAGDLLHRIVKDAEDLLHAKAPNLAKTSHQYQ
jgi:hypothetical protein